jgi:hypothetical protein
MNLVRIVTVIVVLGAICSCSKGKAGSENASGVASDTTPSEVSATWHPIADPCKLLTQAEASEAVGTRVGAGELRHFGSIDRCSFPDAAKDQKLWLDVQTASATVPDSALFDSFTHGPDVKMVSGIGDQAIWNASQIGTFLYILKGGNMVAMGLGKMPTMTPSVEKAAKVIASRM